MWSFGAFCDEFYINARLYFKLELDPSRESLLHFFEQVRRTYPRLTRLRRRDDGALVLDEERQDEEVRRYLRLDANALKFGIYGPPDLEAAASYADRVLTLAPPHLSLSELDYDYMEVVYAFDLEYRGNHDGLVAETLFADHPMLRALAGGDECVIDCQPFFGVAVSEDCDKQVYLEIKGRTSSYEVRTGEFEPAPLSVYLTVRRYWGFGADNDLAEVARDLLTTGQQIATERVVPQVVQPLAAAIASRR